MPRAASTYGISLSDSTTERITRPPNGYAGDGDGDDHRADAGAQRHGDRHGQYQVGKGLQELDDTLARHVEASAEIAAGQPPQGADASCRTAPRRSATVSEVAAP